MYWSNILSLLTALPIELFSSNTFNDFEQQKYVKVQLSAVTKRSEIINNSTIEILKGIKSPLTTFYYNQ